MKVIKGIAISPGIAAGPIYHFERYHFLIPKTFIRPSEVVKELIRFKRAIAKAVDELNQIRELVLDHLDEDHAKIIEAQLMALSDEEMLKQVQEVVRKKHKNITWAYYEVMTSYEKVLEKTLNNYRKERYIDLRDVKRRIIHHLSLKKRFTHTEFTKPSIIVAKRLSPSDLIHINDQNAIGIIAQSGGLNSHVGILSRALRLPYISGVADIDEIAKEKQAILNADKGEVIFGADEKTWNRYLKKAEKFSSRRKESIVSPLVRETKDGQPFQILLNAGFLSEVCAIDPSSVQGIGLFRTEFLCIERNSIPDEDEQFETYTDVLKHMKGLPVRFRTFDFGRDKFMEMLDLEIFHQDDIFDDWGGIQFCLDNPELMKSQLRALLRASVHGPIEIMLPMISSIDEVHRSKELLNIAKEDLSRRGREFSNNIPLGIMVETKDVLDILDELADEVDFFSIGTNDLAQFLLKTKRDEIMTKIYYHPIIFQAIKRIVETAEKSNIPVDVCGEMASNPLALIGLTALGIHSISISSSSLLLIPNEVRNIEIRNAEMLSKEILMADSALTVFSMLNEYYQKFVVSKKG